MQKATPTCPPLLSEVTRCGRSRRLLKGMPSQAAPQSAIAPRPRPFTTTTIDLHPQYTTSQKSSVSVSGNHPASRVAVERAALYSFSAVARGPSAAFGWTLLTHTTRHHSMQQHRQPSAGCGGAMVSAAPRGSVQRSGSSSRCAFCMRGFSSNRARCSTCFGCTGFHRHASPPPCVAPLLVGGRQAARPARQAHVRAVHLGAWLRGRCHTGHTAGGAGCTPAGWCEKRAGCHPHACVRALNHR